MFILIYVTFVYVYHYFITFALAQQSYGILYNNVVSLCYVYLYSCDRWPAWGVNNAFSITYINSICMFSDIWPDIFYLKCLVKYLSTLLLSCEICFVTIDLQWSCYGVLVNIAEFRRYLILNFESVIFNLQWPLNVMDMGRGKVLYAKNIVYCFPVVCIIQYSSLCLWPLTFKNLVVTATMFSSSCT